MHATDKNLFTPLMFAADQGAEGTVGTLLQARANVNSATKGGHTALIMASGRGHATVARLLPA